MKKLLLSLFFLSFALGIQAQVPKTGAVKKVQKQGLQYHMQNYFMVILKKGPNQNQDSITLNKMMEGHLANINRLAGEGKLILAGPFLDNGNMRGIFVFNVATENEVKALLDTDPAVKAGRFSYEIHPWMGPQKLVDVVKKP
ncbi:MAG: YciI family protein [Bacteroidota bacterium]|nr:YciI family protein [Bacteroidota bacterium]